MLESIAPGTIAICSVITLQAYSGYRGDVILAGVIMLPGLERVPPKDKVAYIDRFNVIRVPPAMIEDRPREVLMDCTHCGGENVPGILEGGGYRCTECDSM